VDGVLTTRCGWFAWSTICGSSESILHVSIGWSYNLGDPLAINRLALFSIFIDKLNFFLLPFCVLIFLLEVVMMSWFH